jgi:hypothetical protein
LSWALPRRDIDGHDRLSSSLREFRLCRNIAFALQDWQRTAVEYASAVFIIAPKYPEDPTLADRYLSMCALSLGQYLQDVHVSLKGRLSYTPNRIMYWMKHGVVRPLLTFLLTITQRPPRLQRAQLVFLC